MQSYWVLFKAREAISNSRL